MPCGPVVPWKPRLAPPRRLGRIRIADRVAQGATRNARHAAPPHHPAPVVMHSSLRFAPSLLAALVLGVAPRSAAAQATGSGSVDGLVYDSVQARPRAGATVTVMQVSPAPQQYFTATTDSLGRYHVDSLVAGQFLIGFSTTFLDSLELQFPQRSLTLARSQRMTVDFATPSRATLARAACPGAELPNGHCGC